MTSAPLESVAFIVAHLVPVPCAIACVKISKAEKARMIGSRVYRKRFMVEELQLFDVSSNID